MLIDCPPSLGQLTRSGLVAAQRAVLVTEPTLYAVAGVQRALEAVQAERASNNKQLQPLGVVVNRARPGQSSMSSGWLSYANCSGRWYSAPRCRTAR